MKTLSIVIPALNEEQGILEIVNRILGVADGLEKSGVSLHELIVVDDGSKDRTAQLARDISGVTLIQHPQNRGYGAALKTGFNYAKGDLIGFMDADGTYPPEFFPLLCESALNGVEIVIGSRMSGSESQMPRTRRIGNLFFATLLTFISRQKVTDSASGMRVFHRDVLEKIYPLPNGLNLTPVMSTRAIHEGVSMCEVPIPYSERVGRSKLSVVRDGSVFLHSIIWTALTYNPVRLLGFLGLAGISVALISLLGLIIARLSGSTTLQPWQVTALYAGLVGGIGGVSLYAFGVTFNYLVSLFYNTEIRQGLFGKPIFSRPLEQQFGWVGAIIFLFGAFLASISLVFGLAINEWEIIRLSLYLLLSALFILTGLQLCIYWLLLRVLAELSQRNVQIENDKALQIEPETRINDQSKVLVGSYL